MVRKYAKPPAESITADAKSTSRGGRVRPPMRAKVARSTFTTTPGDVKVPKYAKPPAESITADVDRKSAVEGERVDLGGRRITKKKITTTRSVRATLTTQPVAVPTYAAR